MSVTPSEQPGETTDLSLEEQIEALLREAEELGMAPPADPVDDSLVLEAELGAALARDEARWEAIPGMEDALAAPAGEEDPEDLDPLATQIQRLLDQADQADQAEAEAPQSPSADDAATENVPFEHDLPGDFVAPEHLLLEGEVEAPAPPPQGIEQIDEAIAHEADRSLARARTRNASESAADASQAGESASDRPLPPTTSAAVQALEPEELDALFKDQEDPGASASDVAEELDEQPLVRADAPLPLQSPPAENARVAAKAAPRLRHLLRGLLQGLRITCRRAEYGLRQICFHLNWPLVRRLDPTMRQTLGYIAGLTAFNGAALLLLNCLLR